MKPGKIMKLSLILGLLAVAVIAVLLLFGFYRRDMQTLTQFTTAYDAFDQSIANYSQAVFTPTPNSAQPGDDLERKAESDLTVLDERASVKISSAIKNEQEVMRTTTAVAGLCKDELDALKAYRQAASLKSANLDSLLRVYTDIKNQRQTAYTHFRELGN